ncbi:MAG: excinuclease ABC subunit UvrA, partial [Candidatus Peribacteraceae bacterium]|nr:excinuclease ABC subunit UvrA [Candidatus Peribacteraceae bacterium]
MDLIRVKGARMHNLKNIDVDIPRNSLTVITGLSGSGKSSLAFDTIFAEGQRRYAESLSAYARQFIAQMEKPEVDSIDGLSPAISIDQKTAPRNPRSTVGTVTEIYDYMRLLWAKVGQVHCPITGKPLTKQSSTQITDIITKMPDGRKIILLSPQIMGRKGAHQKILDTIKREGFVRMRVDGQIVTTDEELALDPKKSHDIEIVVDRLVVRDFEPVKEKLSDGTEIEQVNPNRVRLADSVELALKKGDGLMFVMDSDSGDLVKFSDKFVNPDYPDMSIPEIEPRSFSFNSPHGACEHCHGIGSILQVDAASIVPNGDLTVEEGAIHPWATSAGRMSFMLQTLTALAKKLKFSLEQPWQKLSPEIQKIVLYGHTEKVDVEFLTEKFDGQYQTTYEGVIPNLERRHKETDSSYTRSQIEAYMFELPCPECGGKRLRKEILGVTVGKKNIVDGTEMSVTMARKFFEGLIPEKAGSDERVADSKISDRSLLPTTRYPLSAYEYTIVKKVISEIISRLLFLENVGLKYLTLNRSAATLSGGEAQRIRLATQIGSALQGVLYVLDEPSIGLHQRDNTKLIKTMTNLRDIGNTVIVVEHDQETIESADWLLEIGPGAGKHGGRVVAQGTPKKLIETAESVTGQYLSGKKKIPVPTTRRKGNGKTVEVMGATHHNLQNIHAVFPLGCFIGVTGVSGSGKSSLIHGILAPELQRTLNKAHSKGQNFKGITGLEHLDKAIVIDQSPIGRTPRSNP